MSTALFSRPKRRNLPSYRRHKVSGQAIVTLSGSDVYLGPYGTQDEYDRVISEWLANGRSWVHAQRLTALLSVGELILAYWDHAQAYYVKNKATLLRHRRYPYSLNSKTSPGWHSKALQTASNVENRIAFAFPFFNTEILAIVMPTFSASSVTLIFRLASMTSMLMMIAMWVWLEPLKEPIGLVTIGFLEALTPLSRSRILYPRHSAKSVQTSPPRWQLRSSRR